MSLCPRRKARSSARVARESKSGLRSGQLGAEQQNPGRARAALAVIVQKRGSPGSNSFVANDLDGFQSSLADIFVDAGVTNTSVIGRQARIEDHGTGTAVIPMR